jgi:hypothetical protein
MRRIAMTNDCIAVFTARSSHRILREGGSQAWVLDPARARKCKYLICTQNLHNPDRDFSDATEPHGSAFLVGKIGDVVPSPEFANGKRWKICIDEFSTIPNVKDAWKGWRNPVRYTTFEEMGVNPAELKFHPISDVSEDLQFQEAARPRTTSAKTTNGKSPAALSIATAKAGLAAFYGVPKEAIEIVIRG